MRKSRGSWFGFALVILGILLLLDSTGAIDFGDIIRTYWPLVLVIWGITVLMRPGFRRGKSAPPPPGPAGGATPPSPGESLDNTNVFGDLDIRVASPAFRGGSASTVFGDVTVDCRQSGLADGEHALSVSGVFGDTRILLSPGGAYDITAHTLAGDVSVLDQKREGISASISVTTPGYETAPKKMRLRVSRVFGDIDVRQ